MSIHSNQQSSDEYSVEEKPEFVREREQSDKEEEEEKPERIFPLRVITFREKKEEK